MMGEYVGREGTVMRLRLNSDEIASVDEGLAKEKTAISRRISAQLFPEACLLQFNKGN